MTSKIDSLPEDLRQVAEEMLSAKFPEENPFIYISKWQKYDQNYKGVWGADWSITSNVDAEKSEPLTFARMQEAIREISEEAYGRFNSFNNQIMEYWYKDSYYSEEKKQQIVQKPHRYGWSAYREMREKYDQMQLDALTYSLHPMITTTDVGGLQGVSA